MEDENGPIYTSSGGAPMSDLQRLRIVKSPSHNLPLPLTSFIGRKRERAAIKRLLSSTRLLTLTGAGGSGKTRLSLEVAAEILNDFEDGVILVALAPIRDPRLVIPT